MKNNPLIDFLAAYGPVPGGNNMYDEFVVEESKKAGLDPLLIEEDWSRKVVEILYSDEPDSVILTGTAGDGKTFTARKVFEKISNNSDWQSDGEELPVLSLDNGYSVTFIKDMSELDKDRKTDFIRRLLASVTGESEKEIFVACVNDGHLLKTWREHAGDSHEAEKVMEKLRVLLRDDKDRDPGLRLRLFNMSRTSHSEALDSIINTITGHEAWKLCPPSCCASSPDNPCPIRINREILSEEGRGGNNVRARLRSLIEIAAADDQHLSIRQIMILVVNALLGDGENSEKPLLNCTRAKSRSRKRQYVNTNPYSNLFGENHPEVRRQQYTAFSVLNRFGIGDETNNFFDDGLLDTSSNGSMPDHPVYGLGIFRQTRVNYIEDPGKHIKSLREEIRSQRRRLFFSMPDTGRSGDRSAGPWQLSIYQSAGLYLNLIAGENRQDRSLYKEAQKRIIRALNRTLTGKLAETSGALWLPQPSGVHLGQEVPLIFLRPIQWGRGFDRFYIDLRTPATNGRAVRFSLFESVREDPIAELEITPTLFEYLFRVSDGALPTSFSNQCLRDIRNFQIRAVGAIELIGNQEEQPFKYEAVNLSDGELKSNPIEFLDEVAS